MESDDEDEHDYRGCTGLYERVRWDEPRGGKTISWKILVILVFSRAISHYMYTEIYILTYKYIS